jgi:hypothetical protein
VAASGRLAAGPGRRCGSGPGCRCGPPDSSRRAQRRGPKAPTPTSENTIGSPWLRAHPSSGPGRTPCSPLPELQQASGPPSWVTPTWRALPDLDDQEAPTIRAARLLGRPGKGCFLDTSRAGKTAADSAAGAVLGSRGLVVRATSRGRCAWLLAFPPATCGLHSRPLAPASVFKLCSAVQGRSQASATWATCGWRSAQALVVSDYPQ